MSPLILLLTLLFQAPLPRQQQLGVVTGVLRTDGGVPLDGIRVAVKPVGATATDDLLESLAQTNKDGRYRLENVSPGRYYILAGRSFNETYHPGVPGPERATTIVVTAGSTTEVPAMIFARTKVSGRVTDMVTGAGRRVQSVTLCCEYSNTDPSGMFSLVTANSFPATLGEDGAFSFPAVPPGNYFIQVVDSQILAVSQAIAVGNVDIAGVEVKTSTGVEVQGDVVDRTGNALSGVQIRLRQRGASGASDSSVYIPRSGAVLSGTPSALSSLARISLADVEAGILRASTIHLAQVVGGKFSINRVLPGAYVIDVIAPGGHSVERQIEVTPRGVTTVRVEMPLALVAGRIVAAVGEALPKLPGSIRFVGTAAVARIVYAYPEADGRFSALLEPGEYRVFTENLGPTIGTVTDGARDLRTELFVFDGVRSTDIVVTLQ